MKKIFTLAAAVLASLAINADVVYSFELDSTVHKAKDTEYTVNGGSVTFGAEKFEKKDNVYMYKFDGDPSAKNTKYALLKLDNAIAEGDVFTIDGYTASAASDGQEFLLSDSRAATTQYVSLKPEEKGLCTVTWTVPAGNAIIGKQEIYISRKTKSLYLTGVKIESAAAPSTDPELSVDPEEVTLALTAAKLADVAYVTFKGKNLVAGEYALTVPNLDGLRTDPAFVTVGEDGKLNEQVAIAYSSDVDVPLGSTEISLTIGELTSKVKVNYSASLVKNYLSKSVNIEQWVLDNGKKNEEFKAVLEDASIAFENINELDSLNDEKDGRNEPYLGLKLKKQGAFVACWLKKGDRIAVKFGAVKDAVKIGVNGEYQDYPASDESSFIEKTAEQDEYLEIITKSDKTVVLKQIMLNEDIAEVELPDSPTAVDNIEAGAKVTKIVENGQLVIIKNGVKYNAQGTIVK